MSEFGFTLDQINWFGNIVNVVYLPGAFVVPYLYGRLGVQKAVSHPHVCAGFDPSSIFLVLYCRIPFCSVRLGKICRQHTWPQRPRLLRVNHGWPGEDSVPRLSAYVSEHCVAIGSHVAPDIAGRCPELFGTMV